jgi:hypothetical protein
LNREVWVAGGPGGIPGQWTKHDDDDDNIQNHLLCDLLKYLTQKGIVN